MSIGIYTITNLLNKKMLVGQSKKLESRLGQHLTKLRGNYHENSYLQKAFNKYGENNFEFKLLIECNEELLYSEEHYWATILNVHNEKYGYNILETNPYKQINKRTRQYIKKIRLTSVKFSKEAKERMSISKKEYFKTNEHPFKNKNHLETTKNKISNSLKGRKNIHSKEGLEKIRISSKNRKKSEEEIKKITKSHLGSKRSDISKYNMKKNSKTITPVLQYDLEGNFIKEWERIKDAADFLKCNSSGISACCRNKCKTIKNFIWKYKQN